MRKGSALSFKYRYQFLLMVSIKTIGHVMMFFTVLFMLLFASCADHQRTPGVTLSLEEIREKEQYAYSISPQQPIKSIQVLNNLLRSIEQQLDLNKLGIVCLNIANIYDEVLNQYDSALVYAIKSLNVWDEIGDTLQQANLLKYIGYLHGTLGKEDAAVENINMAIELYESKNHVQGSMIAKNNLSLVYFNLGKLELARSNFEESNAYFRQEGLVKRLFTSNILGMKINMQNKSDSTILNMLITENIDLEKMGSLGRREIQHFQKIKDALSN